MPLTPQHGLLSRLLDYVVEQSKEIVSVWPRHLDCRGSF